MTADTTITPAMREKILNARLKTPDGGVIWIEQSHDDYWLCMHGPGMPRESRRCGNFESAVEYMCNQHARHAKPHEWRVRRGSNGDWGIADGPMWNAERWIGGYYPTAAHALCAMLDRIDTERAEAVGDQITPEQRAAWERYVDSCYADDADDADEAKMACGDNSACDCAALRARVAELEAEVARLSDGRRMRLIEAALGGLLANSGGPIQYNGMRGWGLVNCTHTAVAELCGEFADAVLAVRAGDKEATS